MTNQDCIFCKIGRGDVPSDKLFDDGDGAVKANIPSPLLYSFNVTRARIMSARRPEVTMHSSAR